MKEIALYSKKSLNHRQQNDVTKTKPAIYETRNRLESHNIAQIQRPERGSGGVYCQRPTLILQIQRTIKRSALTKKSS